MAVFGVHVFRRRGPFVFDAWPKLARGGIHFLLFSRGCGLYLRAPGFDKTILEIISVDQDAGRDPHDETAPEEGQGGCSSRSRPDDGHRSRV